MKIQPALFLICGILCLFFGIYCLEVKAFLWASFASTAGIILVMTMFLFQEPSLLRLKKL